LENQFIEDLMLTFTVVSTKGGVGKTTVSANFGGMLADLGYRVLLVDADVQPSLTRYFRLAGKPERGLTSMVSTGVLTEHCIYDTQFPEAFASHAQSLLDRGGVLHVVPSDTQDGRLQEWLSNRLDRLVRIRMALKNEAVTSRYDVVIIDTQGAVGHLQDAAVNAADLIIAPSSPDVISAREFIKGSEALLDRHESSANMGYTVPAMKALINRFENTVDSRIMTQVIREQFMTLRGRVSVLATTIPAAVAYRKAATLQVPVHWLDPNKAGDVMHRLMWELIPSLQNRYTPNHRGALSTPDVSSEPEVDLEGHHVQ
jgi:chromosome partitioning related protein ParA